MAGLHLLTEAGVASSSAQAMIVTQSKPIANTTIGYIDHQKAKENIDSFSMSEGENGFWIVTAPTNKPDPDPDFLIAPESAEIIIQQIKARVK